MGRSSDAKSKRSSLNGVAAVAPVLNPDIDINSDAIDDDKSKSGIENSQDNKHQVF